MADKAPYKLVVKLDSARPDTLGQALAQLRNIAGEYDQTGKGEASITIECYKEVPLTNICDDFEEWLFKHAIGIGCEMRVTRPGLRPEMVATLRARYETPMDKALKEAEPIVTPAPREPLQLTAPVDAVEGEFTVDEESADMVHPEGWAEDLVGAP